MAICPKDRSPIARGSQREIWGLYLFDEPHTLQAKEIGADGYASAFQSSMLRSRIHW